MGTFALGMIGAAVGWLALNLLGAPIRRFIDLRERIIRLRLKAQRTPVPIGPFGFQPEGRQSMAAVEKLQDELRDASNEMMAFGHAQPAARALQLAGFDPLKIADAAAAYANQLTGPIERRMNADEALKRTLKVP